MAPIVGLAFAVPMALLMLPRASAEPYDAAPVRVAAAGENGYPVRDVPRACSGYARPGVAAFRDMVLSMMGGSSGGDYVCKQIAGSTRLSYHADGRAWDWYLDAKDPTDRAKAAEIITWLSQDDFATARGFGIGEIIWNGRILVLWNDDGRKAWKTLPRRSNQHIDHVHFSFSTAGAEKQTRWWVPGLVAGRNLAEVAPVGLALPRS